MDDRGGHSRARRKREQLAVSSAADQMTLGHGKINRYDTHRPYYRINYEISFGEIWQIYNWKLGIKAKLFNLHLCETIHNWSRRVVGQRHPMLCFIVELRRFSMVLVEDFLCSLCSCTRRVLYSTTIHRAKEVDMTVVVVFLTTQTVAGVISISRADFLQNPAH